MAAGKKIAAAQGAWICFEDETGCSLAPPTRRTWSPLGRTPLLRVSGQRHEKINVAGLCCYKAGCAPRLIYATSDTAYTAEDFPDLLRSAHRALGAPMVLLWDGLTGHKSGKAKSFLESHPDWLTVVALPGYAPQLNASEGVWAHLKGGVLANLAARTLTEIRTAVYQGLRCLQRSPHLIAGFLAETGLALDPGPSTS